MDFFKNWCFCICSTLIVSVVLSIFTPQDSMKRFYKAMIAVFIFISFIYPLKDFDVDVFKSFPEFQINENIGSACESELNQSVKNFLKEKGITGANVSAKAVYDDENETIEIQELSVYIPDEYDKTEIQKLIFDELGVNARVIYLGE